MTTSSLANYLGIPMAELMQIAASSPLKRARAIDTFTRQIRERSSAGWMFKYRGHHHEARNAYLKRAAVMA
jgi:hypothetical protein